MSNTGAMLAYFLPEVLTNDLAAFARSAFGEYAEPASNLHVTLAYFGEAADITEVQRSIIHAGLIELGLVFAPLAASINGLGRFVGNDPNAVIANVDAPGLAALRAQLLAVLRNASVEPVLDHGFTPHITLAYLPESEPMPTVEFTTRPCVIDQVVLTLGDEQLAYELRGVRALSETITKTQHTSEMYIVAPAYQVSDETRFPVVPTAAGVNIDELTKGDPNPVFVIRPLAILNAVSENGLVYNQALFNDIYRQVLSKRPVARRGHIAAADKGSSFPPDDGYWIGAVIDSTVYGKPTVFGKAYIVPTSSLHDDVLRRRATGTPLSNSLWGDVTEAIDEYGNREPISLELESIDFVPAERAALQALGGRFEVTAEMKGDDGMNEVVETALTMESFKKMCSEMHPSALYECMTAEQRNHAAAAHLNECDGSKVYEMLSEGHRAHIMESKTMTPDEKKALAEAYCAESGMKMVPADKVQQQETAIAEMGTVRHRVSELENIVKQYQRQDYERTLGDVIDGYFSDWQVNTPAGIEKLNALKTNMRVLTVSEMAGSTKVDDIAPAAEKAWPNVKPLAEMTKATLAGPSVNVGAPAAQRPNGWDGRTGRYSEEFVAQASRMFGMPIVRGGVK